MSFELIFFYTFLDALTARKDEWPTINKEETLTDLLDFSKDTNKAYSFMCKVIAPCAVGKSHWAKSCHKELLSKLMGKVDEAFCILVLTNYWDKWWAMVEGDEEEVKSTRTKWTDEGKGANARLNGGWSKEGRSELGRIVKLVIEDRSARDESQKAIRMSFEKYLLDHYQQQDAAKRGKKRKAIAEPAMLDNEEFMDDLNELLGYNLAERQSEAGANVDELVQLATNHTQL